MLDDYSLPYEVKYDNPPARVASTAKIDSRRERTSIEGMRRQDSYETQPKKIARETMRTRDSGTSKKDSYQISEVPPSPYKVEPDSGRTKLSRTNRQDQGTDNTREADASRPKYDSPKKRTKNYDGGDNLLG